MTRYKAETLKQYVESIFRASGSVQIEASQIAGHLIEANLLGHDSHGIIRVIHYLNWLDKGWVKPNKAANIIKDSGSVLVVDGDFGYGQVIAKQAMNMAIARMNAQSVLVVAIRNTGHIGRVGAWAEMLAHAGFISLHFVNTSGCGIRMAPFGGRERRFSTNPICIGVPAAGKPPIVLDMSTGKIPEGKILVAIDKGEHIPEGMILDGDGNPTCDPQGFFDDPQGAVLPIAGPKGSGLAFMIEVLAGALTGGASSHPDNPTAKMIVNNMFSVVINPDQVSGNEFFQKDISRLMEWTKSSKPMRDGGEILLPGEFELRTKQDRISKGIPLDATTIQQLESVAT
ncbi:MAG TPA: malate/lactate/ureidoglycolate dehydrogenase, partial [Hellea balneolensis]|nr:malate/lactate/ureidoglycolate dehydrogenase [Hellea balneolensis]